MAAELTEEEQAQVDEVIALIDALPTQAEIEEALTALEDAGDEDGYDAYLAEIVTQAKAAYEAYSALMEVQQEKVTNAAKLMALEPFWSVQVLPDENGGSTDPIQLSQYAAANEGKVEITVSDKEGALLEPDADGYYNVTAGETYNIRVVYEGDKLAKGKYYVAFPANIDLKQQNCDLTFKDNQGTTIDAGRWYSQKNEDGTVWLIFDITGDLSKHSDIILTADVTCNFAYTEEPIEFDGNINVKVHHNEDFQNTDVSKWAKDLNPEKPNKSNGGLKSTEIPDQTSLARQSPTRSQRPIRTTLQRRIRRPGLNLRPQSISRKVPLPKRIFWRPIPGRFDPVIKA